MLYRRFALIACVGCSIGLQACGNDGDPSVTGGVMRAERVWTDISRPLPRIPARQLRVVLWVTVGREPQPLLILAHGFGGLPEKFDAFARAIALAGYVVAAPAFPLTNQNAPGGHERGLMDFIHQPGDVRFVIDRLLEANADPADPLFSRIAFRKIAVLGHSLGGLTVLAATRKNCCRDDRIAATVLFAPLAGFFLDQFGSDSVSNGPPSLVVHGLADVTLAFEGSVLLYQELRAPKALVGLQEADHSEALESQEIPSPRSRRAAERVTTAFLDAVFFCRVSALEVILDELGGEGHVVERDLPRACLAP